MVVCGELFGGVLVVFILDVFLGLVEYCIVYIFDGCCDDFDC